jgi:hypothetical protein
LINTLEYVARIGKDIEALHALVADINPEEIGPKGKAYLQTLVSCTGEMLAQGLAAGCIAASFMDPTDHN